MSLGGDKIEASKRLVDETKRLYAKILPESLDERQLARPPFKFIQKLAKQLITETRILRDVFKPADFSTTDAPADRKFKLNFIQKLIDFVAHNEQPVLNCVASRVLAGLEPNKTNELLQALARVAIYKKNAALQDRNRPRTYVKPLYSSPPQNRSRPTLLTSGPKRALSSGGGGKSSPLTSAKVNQKLPVGYLQVAQDALKSSSTGQDFSPVSTENLELSSNDFSRKSSLRSIQSAESIKNKSTLIANLERQVAISSESDILKGIQHLKTNLKSLKLVLSSVQKNEELLESKLIQIKLQQQHL